MAGIRERELNAWWRTLTVRQKELVQAHWIMATMLTWLENPEHFKQLLAEAKERKNEREA